MKRKGLPVLGRSAAIFAILILMACMSGCGNFYSDEDQGDTKISSAQPEQQLEQDAAETRDDNAHEGQTPISKEESSAQLYESDLYASVLEMYGQAMSLPPTDDVSIELSQRFTGVNSNMMCHYYSAHMDGENGFQFYSALYDIDHNGVDELLIGCNPWDEKIVLVDAYALSGDVPVKLQFEDPSLGYETLGERSSLSIYPDGGIVLMGASGAEQVCYSLFHISENGYTLTEPEILIDTGSQPELLGQDLDAIVEQELGGQQALTDFAWSPIQPAESQE